MSVACWDGLKRGSVFGVPAAFETTASYFLLHQFVELFPESHFQSSKPL